ncbi:MAG: hypothetical protein JWN03_9083, partial [Nocardia sp.]|nr:hypothetical protein [Nocardia sp.]MCU1648808.1 hypothetical protein [Nocardia sp.]
MPEHADPGAVQLHVAAAAAIRGGDGAGAEAAIREIVLESATAVADLGTTTTQPEEAH